MGKVAYPEMKRSDYGPSLASGCIAAGGTLGILIPPSIGFIIVGILTELSIGRLFMAGIIPGILEIVFYCHPDTRHNYYFTEEHAELAKAYIKFLELNKLIKESENE